MTSLRRLGFAGCLWFAATQAISAEHPCRVAGLPNEVLCGQVQRPLNPAQPQGVQIDIHYVRVHAVARRKLPDPVFMLAGGPGQSAIDLASTVMPLLSRLNNRRDIVFVDQRGTGRSAPLQCGDIHNEPLSEQADPERQFAHTMVCLAKLKQLPYGDLRFFTTPVAVQDLDAVRQQLGAERINLIGGSYGTRVALDYQRQFPHAVRRSVLDGVAPPDMVLPAAGATDTQAAFDALLIACEQEPACRQAHPALRSDWATLLASLPRTVTLPDPLTGQDQALVLTREMVLGMVRAPLYAPAFASALPQAISEAAQGRFAGLAGLSSLLSSRKTSSLAMGMHFSVVCAEDYPRIAQATDGPSRDFGDSLARPYQRVCAQWPQGEVPAAFYALPRSATPVLLLSGGLDPATPPRHGARVAQALGAQARHVVVPNAGHGVMALGCMREVMFRFIDAADEAAARAVDASCVTSIPRPPAFAPLKPQPEAAR